MTYVKLPDTSWLEPAVLGLSHPTWRLHHTAMEYASQNLTDGNVPKVAVAGMLPGASATKAAGELVKAGLWERTEAGWMIVGYLDHNRSRAQVDKLKQDRADAGKKGGEAKANALASASPGANDPPGNDGGKPPAEVQSSRGSTSSSSSNGSSNGAHPTEDEEVWETVTELRRQRRVAECGPVGQGWVNTVLADVSTNQTLHRMLAEGRSRWPFATTEELALWLEENAEPRRYRCQYCGTEGLTAEEFRDAHGEGCEMQEVTR